MKFHFGPLQRDIEEGEEIKFDGTTMLINGDEKHSMPKLRGVIKAGWLIPEGQASEAYRPKPAGILVRPADELKARDEGRTGKHSMDMVGHEERVVVSQIGSDSGAQIGSGNRIPDARPNQHTASVVSGGTLGAQGGKTVGSIGSASGAAVGAEGDAVGRSSMTVTASNIGRLKSEQRQREEQFGKRETVSGTPEGVDVADLLEEEDPDTAARLRERRAAAKASEAKVGGHPNDKAAPAADPEVEGDREVGTSEAPDATTELSGLWDGEGEGGEAAPAGEPKAKLKPKGASEEEKKKLADFEWDKTRHWSKRVEDAVSNYANQPRFLRKILAMETPTVAEKIEARLEELGL